MWIMAFDYGAKRIGVAVGDTRIKMAHPLIIVEGRNKFEKLDKIRKLIGEWKPTLLVVGSPSDGANDPNKKLFLEELRRFINRLKHNFKLEVVTIDEDYSSALASLQLKEQNIFGRRQKNKLDSLSACNILQTYFTSIVE